MLVELVPDLAGYTKVLTHVKIYKADKNPESKKIGKVGLGDFLVWNKSFVKYMELYLQEIVPLNVGNIFVAKDSRLVPRTQFSTSPNMGRPQTIHNHEIFWLGDLNYRINLPYERTHELISEKNWSELLERDQGLCRYMECWRKTSTERSRHWEVDRCGAPC